MAKPANVMIGALLVAALVDCVRYEAAPSTTAYAPPPPPLAEAAPEPPRSAARGYADYGGIASSKAVGDYDKQAHKGQAEEALKQARMVHYDGSIKLRVTDPRKTIDEAAIMAEGMGGYVEQQTDNLVTLRIPVAKVRDAFTKLLRMGEVLSRSLTAQDITDAFTASELRLKTLRAARDRLVALLSTVNDENERLQLLSEISRLTEAIDSLDLQVKTLAKLAAYSRLTLEAVPRETRGSTKADALAAFRWLDDLSPFRRDSAAREGLLELATPKEMVVLDNAKHWVAESADGAVVWTSKRKNRPEGSSDFWASAIAERLGPDFAETERTTIGRYDFVSFVDAGEAHYRYLIGVRADGANLETIEIYYPTPAHEARYAPAVEAAITGGAT